MNISGGTEVGACFLSPARRAADVGVFAGRSRARAWRSTCSTTTASRCAAQVGELVCTKPWPGMTRGLFGDPERYLDTYWSRWPDVWWHGDFASVERRRAVVPARSLRRHDQARGEAARSGRGRDGRGRAPGGARGGRDRRARRAEGRGAVGVRGARRRVSSPTTRCAPSSWRGRRRARAVVQARGRCGSRPRCRRRAARRCCGARFAPIVTGDAAR